VQAKNSLDIGATLKAEMMERRNGGITESRNRGKCTQILKDGIAEWRNGEKSPQILKDGIAERRNDGLNTPKS